MEYSHRWEFLVAEVSSSTVLNLISHWSQDCLLASFHMQNLPGRDGSSRVPALRYLSLRFSSSPVQMLFESLYFHLSAFTDTQSVLDRTSVKPGMYQAVHSLLFNSKETAIAY